MSRIFNTTFAKTDITRRARHGKIWSYDELETLRRMFEEGAALRFMCERLERPADGCIAKLHQLGLIMYDGNDYYIVDKQRDDYFDSLKYAPVLIHKPNEEPTMTAPTIETKTFIQGEDAATLTDTQIFSKIAKLEAEIEKLDKIQNKPKKLVAVIEKLKEDINKLVEFVDARV